MFNLSYYRNRVGSQAVKHWMLNEHFDFNCTFPRPDICVLHSRSFSCSSTTQIPPSNPSFNIYSVPILLKVSHYTPIPKSSSTHRPPTAPSSPGPPRRPLRLLLQCLRCRFLRTRLPILRSTIHALFELMLRRLGRIRRHVFFPNWQFVRHVPL